MSKGCLYCRFGRNGGLLSDGVWMGECHAPIPHWVKRINTYHPSYATVAMHKRGIHCRAFQQKPQGRTKERTK